MKSIIEITNDELFFSLPINGRIEVDLTCQYKTVENPEYDQYGFRGMLKEYITETSNEYMRLIEFIKLEKMAVYGMCPCCKKMINFNVTSNVELPEDVCKTQVSYYNDTYSEDYLMDIPDDDVIMEERANMLLMQSKFIDKYLYCPLCNNVYRVSFVLEFEKKKDKRRLLLVKVGQYPSLYSFANQDLKLLEKILTKFKIKEDYRSALRMHIDGYNIAAYVYLRRVLEKIVLAKYTGNKDAIDDELESQIKKEIEEKIKLESKEEIKKEIEAKIRQRYSGGFMHLDFSKQLKLLKGYVPDFFTDNVEIYSIVSAGIHSLEEEKCKEYYDTLQLAIDMILHEEEALRKKEMLMKKTKKGIQSAVEQIKKEI